MDHLCLKDARVAAACCHCWAFASRCALHKWTKLFGAPPQLQYHIRRCGLSDQRATLTTSALFDKVVYREAAARRFEEEFEAATKDLRERALGVLRATRDGVPMLLGLSIVSLALSPLNPSVASIRTRGLAGFILKLREMFHEGCQSHQPPIPAPPQWYVTNWQP
eukprot:522494-Prymnesium_polylepis.2